MDNKANILIYDIETSYLEGAAWGTYQQDLLWVSQDWHLLSFSWKWLGGRQTFVSALPDFKRYKKEPRNDIELVTKLHQLFNMADIVVAHNGDKFDQRKVHARMLAHGFEPPAPYAQVDTLKVARKYFAMTSNKLDDIGEYLGVGRKLDTGGKYLWKQCVEGDPKAWARMKKYNVQDVKLLEQVYLKLRPWMTNHPSFSVIEGRPQACKNCGGTHVNAGMKYKATNSSRYQYFRCMDCGANMKSRIAEKADKPLYV